MKKKSLKVLIASLVVLAMTVSALPVQFLNGLTGSSSVVHADDIRYLQGENRIRFPFDTQDHIIVFEANDGSGNKVERSVIVGHTAYLDNPDFSRENYYILEWNTQPDGSGTAYSLGESLVMPDSDVVLYAQWKRMVYDFSTDPLEDGWRFIDYDGDGHNWIFQLTPEYNKIKSHSGESQDGSVIHSYSYDPDYGSLTPDNWAITPSGFVDPNGTKTVTLWAIGQDSMWAAEHFAIYAAEADNVDLETLDLDQWQKISEEYVATGEYQMYTGDLSEFTGKEVYVAIRHFHVSDMYMLNIDDVYLPFYIPEPDPFGEALEGYSISLDGDIAVNFYMSLDEEVVERGTAEMVFTVPNGEKTETQIVKLNDVGDPKEVNGKFYYVFKCRVSAKDMVSDISAQLVDGELSGDVYTYSVKSYAEYLLDHPETCSAEDRELVSALLTYGAMAQIYFGVNTDNLAYARISESAERALSHFTADDLSQYAVSEVALPDDVVFEGATLSLKSETTLSLYFTSDVVLSFSCEEYPIDVTAVGSYQVVRIRGIKAWHLGNAIGVTVTSTGTGTVRFSPMTYCYNVLNEEYDEDLQNICKALYIFFEAGREFLNPAS